MSGRPNDKMFKTMAKRYGSLKAAKAHMAEIGRKGGSVEHPETRAFHTNRKLASEAGYLGGIVTGAQYKTRRKDATV